MGRVCVCVSGWVGGWRAAGQAHSPSFRHLRVCGSTSHTRMKYIPPSPSPLAHPTPPLHATHAFAALQGTMTTSLVPPHGARAATGPLGPCRQQREGPWIARHGARNDGERRALPRAHAIAASLLHAVCAISSALQYALHPDTAPAHSYMHHSPTTAHARAPAGPHRHQSHPGAHLSPTPRTSHSPPLHATDPARPLAPRPPPLPPHTHTLHT
jgi:hypothetical protein